MTASSATRPSLSARLGLAASQTPSLKLYAEVAVNATFPSRQTFSYGVPDGHPARPGMAAYVPFGRLTLQGIVMEVHERPVFTEPEKIRDIRSLVGEEPIVDGDRLGLARWIADHYLAPIFDAVALFLPPGFERKPVTTVHALVDSSDLGALTLPPRLRAVLDAIIAHERVTVDELKRSLKVGGEEGSVAALESRGLVLREYSLSRPTVAEKTMDVASLVLSLEEALAAMATTEPRKRSRRADILQLLMRESAVSLKEATKTAGSRANLERLIRAGDVSVLNETVTLAIPASAAERRVLSLTRTSRAARAESIIRALADGGEESLAGLRDSLGASLPTLRWLAGIGIIAIEKRHVERDPLASFHVVRHEAAHLLPAQSAAADTITRALDEQRHQAFLLHGVTGSGKTEVYLHALDRCLALGRRAIVLVPEIALTPQTIRRFRERFARVAVLHSGLTEGQLFDQWHGIAGGNYDVVIGARSAVFAPQPDLGLIVVDEEHEWTYKQHDPAPRYDARDVALELARARNAAVVFGSATPDVSSYHRAATGDYTMLTLPERIRPDSSGAPAASYAMPRVEVVDLREELRTGNAGMFSARLRDAVDEALLHDEQVILFLNRRGMAGHVQCRDCGFVPECGSCAVALTYHRQYDRLVCHQCNKRWRLPAKCRHCGSPRVRLLGAGIEKVESEAARHFPHARLLRWDRDVTRTRGAHDRILAAFLARDADILIGTQMVAKGLDMPAVTVVGVVNADTALHLPDFRAGERTFQLLTQVAGRAGRGERPGRVVIQTYTPDHYAISCASRYDYDGFADRELEWRRAAGYPPFGRLAQLTLTHSNPRWAREEAIRLHKVLTHRRAELGSDTDVLGPAPAYVPRVRGRYRWQILLRGRAPIDLISESGLPEYWVIDVDPASLV